MPLSPSSVTLSRRPSHRGVRGPSLLSTVGEETILRTTAVDGVGELARERQNRDAVEALWEFLKQPSLSVRRAAMPESLYGSVGNNKRVRDRIGSLLPDEQRFLLDLKPVEVTGWAQIPGRSDT